MSDPSKVVIVGVDIPFRSLVRLVATVTLAAIPAVVMLLAFYVALRIFFIALTPRGFW
jgi:hypothetical protein